MSVLINIGGGDLNAVYLSYLYIQNRFNKITQAVSSAIRQTWFASKKPSGALGRQN